MKSTDKLEDLRLRERDEEIERLRVQNAELQERLNPPPAENNPQWEHADDTCEKCDSTTDCWRGRYPEDGYDYLTWVCQECGHIADRHEYHAKEHVGGK